MKSVTWRVASKILIREDGCWEWVGSRHERGYGLVTIGGRTMRAHRVMYELLVGPIPSGLSLDHLCRFTSCVNPGHLDPVTHLENMRRGHWSTSDRTHCPNGHPFDEENTYHRPDNARACRTCMRAASRRWKQRRKGQV